MPHPQNFDITRLISRRVSNPAIVPSTEIPECPADEGLFKNELVVNSFGEGDLINDAPGLYLRVGTATQEELADKIVRIGNAFVTDDPITALEPTTPFSETVSALVETGELWYRKTDKAFFVHDGTSWSRVTPLLATYTLPGIVRLATEEETLIGESEDSAVTPAGLTAWKDNLKLLSKIEISNEIHVNQAFGDDSLENDGLDPHLPFLTIERALLEEARRSFVPGNSNDKYKKTTIIVHSGDYLIDNRPGLSQYTSLYSHLTADKGAINPIMLADPISAVNITDGVFTVPNALESGLHPQNQIYSSSGGTAVVVSLSNTLINVRNIRGTWLPGDRITYSDYSVFNSPRGGLIVPRGASIIGMDLRKCIVRPRYLGDFEAWNQAADCDCIGDTYQTARFRVTGASYIANVTFSDNLNERVTHHLCTAVEFASTEDLNSSSFGYYRKIYRSLARTVDPNIVLSEYEARLLEYNIVSSAPNNVQTDGNGFIAVDTVEGASPYISNCSLLSRFGATGLWINGSAVGGFKSFVCERFTNISLQDDPRAFDVDLDAPGNKVYKSKWRHVSYKAFNDGYAQLVSCFTICSADHYATETGGELSLANCFTNFGDTAFKASGYSRNVFPQDKGATISKIIPPKPLSNTLQEYTVGTLNADLTTTSRLYVNGYLDEDRIKPFSFQPGDTLYIRYVNDAEYTAILADDECFVCEEDGEYYLNVNAIDNNIFTNRSILADFFIYVKRRPDKRKSDDRIYWLEVQGLNLNGRRPPQLNYVVRLDETAMAGLQLTKPLFIADIRKTTSDNVELPEGVYHIALLGADGFNDSLNELYPEVVIDSPSTVVVDSKNYIATRSFLEGLGLSSENINSLLDASDTAVNIVDDLGDTLSVVTDFVKPSIIRAFGTGLEWVGYGNYSSALPKYQDVSLSLQQFFRKLKSEQYGGRVYNVGMTHDGLFIIGDRIIDLRNGNELDLSGDSEEDSRVFKNVTITNRLFMYPNSELNIASAVLGVDIQTRFKNLITSDYEIYATTERAGVVELATVQETIDGTSNTLAVTPFGLAGAISSLIPAILRPFNISPLDGTSIEYPAELVASSYYSLYGKPMQKSVWQLSLTEEFTTIALEEEQTGFATSFEFDTTLLTPDEFYYWRVKYVDVDDYESKWSIPTRFLLSAFVPPAKPTNITPTDGGANIGYNLAPVQLSVSAYSHPESVPQQSVQWVVTTAGDVNFANPVINQTVSSTSATYTVLNPASVLNVSTQYRWRVRHRSVQGLYSEWSNSTIFTTASNFGSDIPVITQQPQNQTVLLGDTASFTVVATGSNLTYQWRKGGTNIVGATSSTYSFTATQTADDAPYTVVVTNIAGSAISNQASVTLTYSAPIITQHPQSQSINFNSNATLTVVASGSNLTYQWRKGGANIVGATSSTYSFIVDATADDSPYSVVVSNPGNSIISNDANITILYNAPVITQQPQNQTTSLGSTATFDVIATGVAPLTYQWRKGGVDIVGATSSSYSFTVDSTSDDASYTVAVTNAGGTVVSNSASLTISTDAPVIIQHPQSQTVNVGSLVNLSVVATGSGTLTYQWRKGGVNIVGATSSTYSFTSDSTTDDASYTVVVSNVNGGSGGIVTSNPASITLIFGNFPGMNPQYPLNQLPRQNANWDKTHMLYAEGCIEISKDNVSYTAGPLSLTVGDSLWLRWKNTSLCGQQPHSTTLNGNVTDNDYSAAGSIVIDRVPASFSFTNLTNQAVSSISSSNLVTLSGLNFGTKVWASQVTGAQISINGGSYAALNASSANAFTVPYSGNITLSVRQTNSSSVSTDTSLTLFVGDDDTNKTTTVWTTTTSSQMSSISQPDITNPVDNALDPSISAGTLNITASTYTPVGGAGVHDNSDWEVWEEPFQSTNLVTSTVVDTNDVPGVFSEFISNAFQSPEGLFALQVGNSTNILRSLDGLTWTPVYTSGVPGGAEVGRSSLVYVNGANIIYTKGRTTYTNSAYISNDGISWAPLTITGDINPDPIYSTTKFTFRKGNTNSVNGIRNFMAACVDPQGTQSGIYFSGNGSVWNRLFSSAPVTDIAYGNNVYVGVGTGGSLYVSTDEGVTWVVSIFGGDDIIAVDYDSASARFILHTSVNTYATSVNGLSWTSASVGTLSNSYNFSDNYLFLTDGTNYISRDDSRIFAKLSSSFFRLAQYPNIPSYTQEHSLETTTNYTDWSSVYSALVGTEPIDDPNDITLNIVGAFDDGFRSGDRIRSIPNVFVDGILDVVTNSYVTILPGSNVALGNPSNPPFGYRIGMEGSNIALAETQIVNSTANVSNKTSYPLSSSLIKSFSSYKARVRYRSVDPVVSDWSEWSTFKFRDLVIVTQPQDLTVVSGQNATFSVTASNPGTATYQWRRNGVDISGAVSSTYTLLSSTSSNNNDLFQVVVTIGGITSTSREAKLTVNSAPVFISQPQSTTVVEGSDVTFSVIISGNPTPSLQWKKDGVNIVGATLSSYTLTNAQLSDDNSVFSVVATNIVSSLLSGNATLDVSAFVPPPSIDKPSILTPANDATNIIAVNIQSSTYTARNGAGAHDNSDWEIRVFGSTNLLISSNSDASGTDTSTNTTYGLARELITESTSYEVRVRYRSTDGVLSPYSDWSKFTTAADLPAFITGFEAAILPVNQDPATNYNTGSGVVLAAGSITNVIYLNNAFFATIAGSSQGFSGIIRSTDAINWQIVLYSGQSSDGMYSITYGNGLYMAVSQLTLAYSYDGINWLTKVNTSGGQTIPIVFEEMDMHYNPSTFTFKMFYSGQINGEPPFIGVGTRFSEVAALWTRAQEDTVLDSWRRMLYVNNRTFFTNTNGGLVEIQSFPTYNADSSLPTVVVDMVYGNGMYVVVCSDGTIRYSTSADFNTWTLVPGIAGTGVSSTPAVTFSDGLFVVTGEYIAGGAYIRFFTSEDGINWVTGRNYSYKNDSLPSGTRAQHRVTYGNGKFVYCNAKSIYYSTSEVV